MKSTVRTKKNTMIAAAATASVVVGSSRSSSRSNQPPLLLPKKLLHLPLVALVLVVLVLAATLSSICTVAAVATTATRPDDETTTAADPRRLRRSPHHPPNFVVVLADDLDWTLGGASASTLSRTRALLVGGGDDCCAEKEGGGTNDDDDVDDDDENNGKRGVLVDPWFVQTPVCCSSRAEMLTGMMYHNLKVGSPSSEHPGCMHVDVDPDDPNHPFWNDRYFARYFAGGGGDDDVRSAADDDDDNATKNSTTTGQPQPPLLSYKVGIFGKHLNPGFNPTGFLPRGVDEMLINGGGSYLDPSFLHGYRRRRRRQDDDRDDDEDDVVVETVRFDNCTETTGMPCYSTSVIGNASLAWIRRQVGGGGGGERNDDDPLAAVTPQRRPFFAYIGVKAPHIQDGPGFPRSIPAPWYADAEIPEKRAPRTPNYNATGDDDDGGGGGVSHHRHHWLIRAQSPLTDLEADAVDALYVSRLKTLMSVDDLVVDLIDALEDLKVIDDTYVIFTSDNGYRLGQFRMPQCKLHPYENDVRVPMMIRGPGIGGDVDDAKKKKKVRRRTAGTTTGADAGEEEEKERAAEDGDRDDDRDGGRAVFSHVHLIPTLLGLATGKHRSQEIVPKTMDGTNLAHRLLSIGKEKHDDDDDDIDIDEQECDDDESRTTDPGLPAAAAAEGTDDDGDDARLSPERSLSSSSSLTANAESESVSLLIEYTSLGDVVRYQHLIDTYNHSFVALRILPRRKGFAAAAASGNATVTSQQRKRRRRWEKTIRNLKYVEFRDSRVDWTNARSPPLERELYDLDSDPYEMRNLAEEAPPSLAKALREKVRRLILCRGETCRSEHATGLRWAPEEESEEREEEGRSFPSSF